MAEKETLGARIARLRKGKELTQEGLAEKLGITAQAVSKWENDLSAPDISALPLLADALGVSVDGLLRGEEAVPAVRMQGQDGERKSIDEMVFRIRVDGSEGDKVSVNLPMALIVMLLKSGIPLSDMIQSDGSMKKALAGIDFDMIVRMVESGMIGRLVEVDSADGDHVEIVVE